MAHFVCLRMVCVSRSVTPTFDLLTLKIGVRVAPNVGNLPSKFEHVRWAFGSRIIRYVRDRRTDKSNSYCPLPYGREHKNTDIRVQHWTLCVRYADVRSEHNFNNSNNECICKAHVESSRSEFVLSHHFAENIL